MISGKEARDTKSTNKPVAGLPEIRSKSQLPRRPELAEAQEGRDSAMSKADTAGEEERSKPSAAVVRDNKYRQA